jgi:adhesin transport system outer membrane protein
LGAHPELRSANADIQARRKQDEVAKSPFMPIVDFELDQIYEEDTNYSSYYDVNNEREDLRLFLRLRYNLFNGWKDVARKQETFELVNEAREIRNHTHRQVIESVRLSWRAHEAAKQKVEYLRQRQQFAAATATAYTKQWNIGGRTLLDVLDAEAERIDAARQLTTAEYDGLYARYRILNGTGRLLPVLQLAWPEEGGVADENAPAQTQRPQPEPTRVSLNTTTVQ